MKFSQMYAFIQRNNVFNMVYVWRGDDRPKLEPKLTAKFTFILLTFHFLSHFSKLGKFEFLGNYHLKRSE